MCKKEKYQKLTAGGIQEQKRQEMLTLQNAYHYVVIGLDIIRGGGGNNLLEGKKC